METTSRHGLFLIQRVKSSFANRRDGLIKDIKSIDHYFEMEYMGSSEFEWGAIPQALKGMRARAQMNDFVTEPKRLKVAGQYLCWYVGPEDEFDLAKALFIDQLGLSGTQQSLQEPSYIHDNYVDPGPPGALNGRPLPSRFAKSRDHYNWCDGWWAVQRTFAIFKTKEDAKIWLHCVFNGVSSPTPAKGSR